MMLNCAWRWFKGLAGGCRIGVLPMDGWIVMGRESGF